MNNRPTSQADEVVTEVLDFFPSPNTKNPLMDAIDFGRKYHVSVELDTTIRPGSGGHSIRLRGSFWHVYECLRKEYSANEVEGSLEQNLYIRGLMGDDLAHHRWMTGCTAIKGHSTKEEPSKELSPYEKYGWHHHWITAGVDDTVSYENQADTDAETEKAISMLVDAGYTLEDDEQTGTEHVDFAQTYLTLAFLHCPKLLDNTSEDESKEEAYTHMSDEELWTEIHLLIGEGRRDEAKKVLFELNFRLNETEGSN